MPGATTCIGPRSRHDAAAGGLPVRLFALPACREHVQPPPAIRACRVRQAVTLRDAGGRGGRQRALSLVGRGTLVAGLTDGRDAIVVGGAVGTGVILERSRCRTGRRDLRYCVGKNLPLLRPVDVVPTQLTLPARKYRTPQALLALYPKG